MTRVVKTVTLLDGVTPYNHTASERVALAKKIREHMKAAQLLGFQCKLLAKGDWRCTDGEILFARDGAEVKLKPSGSLYNEDGEVAVLKSPFYLASLVLVLSVES